MPTINCLNVPVIIASEHNLSIDLPSNYAVIDTNATRFAHIDEQGMTHSYNITDISNPQAGNATVEVLSVGEGSLGINFADFFQGLTESFMKTLGGKIIGERIVKDIKGQNVSVTTFDMGSSRYYRSIPFGKQFDLAAWNIDELNTAYLIVPSTLGQNVTNKIISTLTI